jgi:hypothetical protein
MGGVMAEFDVSADFKIALGQGIARVVVEKLKEEILAMADGQGLVFDDPIVYMDDSGTKIAVSVDFVSVEAWDKKEAKEGVRAVLEGLGAEDVGVS